MKPWEMYETSSISNETPSENNQPDSGPWQYFSDSAPEPTDYNIGNDILDEMQFMSDNKKNVGFAPDEPKLGNTNPTLEEVKESTTKKAEAFQTGTAATFAGGYQSALDLADAIGIDVKEASEENLKVIDLLNEEMKKQGEGFWSGLGQLAPSLATLPIAYQSKATAFLVEGAIGYALARGEDSDKVESGIVGLLTGGSVATTMKVIDMLKAGVAPKVYEYVKDFTNTSDEEADEIFSKWAKTMEAEDTPSNRLKALIDSMGDKGAHIKIEAASGDPLATKQIEGAIKERRQAVEALTEGKDKVEYTAQSVKEASDIVKSNYKLIKEHISDKPTELRLSIPDALDEATTGDAKAVKEIFSKDTITIKDLVDAMPHINALLRRTKGTTKHQWNVIKHKIDNNLKGSLSSKDYKMWQQANEDYARMATVTTHRIGSLMSDTLSGKITPEDAIKKMKTISGGEALFRDLEFLIGTEKTAAFEKALLEEAMGKNSEFVDWAHLARNLDHKGFVTDTGKNIKKVVDQMAESFATDDAIQEIIFRDKGLVAGMSDDILAKIRYSLVGKAFTALVKRIPFNETSKHMLRMSQLGEILKNPTKVKNLMKELDEMAPGVKQKFIEDTVKQIEWKPLAKETGDVDLYTKYVSSKGTVGDNPTTVTLSDAQTDIVRQALGSSIKSDKVMSTINKLMEGKRAQSILRNVSDRMKADDAIGNMRMLRKMVKEESDYIIKAIEKDVGIKIPQEEAEKIYKLKIAELLRECE